MTLVSDTYQRYPMHDLCRTGVLSTVISKSAWEFTAKGGESLEDGDDRYGSVGVRGEGEHVSRYLGI